VLALCFASYLGFGLVLILVGANQAELSRYFGLDFAQTGQLVSALAAGLGVGVVAAGPLFDRYPQRPLFVGTLALAAVALFSIGGEVSFTRLIVHLFAAGMGIGGYNTLINATVAERFAERSARPMSMIHAGASVGAMLGPALIGWLWADDWRASFHFTGAGHAALAAGAACVRFPVHGSRLARGEREDPPIERNEPSSGKRNVLSTAMIPFAGIAFAYVGIETALIVFAIPYSAERGLAEEVGRSAISIFWLGLLLGRLAIVGWRAVPGAGLLVGAGSFASLLLAAGIGLGGANVDALFGALGFAMGSVYPVNMALTGQRFSRTRGVATGAAAGAGALGGFAVPWWTGAVGDAVGIGAALSSLVGFTLLIALLAAMLWRSP